MSGVTLITDAARLSHNSALESRSAPALGHWLSTAPGNFIFIADPSAVRYLNNVLGHRSLLRTDR